MPCGAGAKGAPGAGNFSAGKGPCFGGITSLAGGPLGTTGGVSFLAGAGAFFSG